MRKIYFLYILFFLPWMHYSQINYFYDWEVENQLGGWSNSGESEMVWTNEGSSDGTGSVNTNFYNFSIFGVSDNIFVSPNLGASNQGLVTLNLKYKVLDVYDDSGAASSYFKITMQWSNSNTGPWNSFYEINATNHIATNLCTTATATFSPGSGNIYVRFVAQDLSDGAGDYLIIYDDVSLVQGAAPTCLIPSNVQNINVTKNSSIIQWQAPSVVPQNGYEYEIRTFGLPGSGSVGLVQNGTVLNSVLSKNIINLSPSTQYFVYVRSLCLANDKSLWSNASVFVTLCEESDFVSVAPTPVLILSTNQVSICEGETALVTVISGASDYSSFVWFPATGVTGNAITGWTFNPTESTVYTLTATQNSDALCSNILNVNVRVKALPLMLDLDDEFQICASSILPLKVGDATVWPSNYFNSFESNQLEGFDVSGTGVINATTTTLVSSVGARSMNITHAINVLGYVTLSSALDLSDFTTPYLTFDHIAAFEGNVNSFDFGYVEYSLDGGGSWIPFKPADYVGTASAVGSTNIIGQRFTTKSYAEWISVFTSNSVLPNNTLWKTERFNFPANADLSNVKIRFKVIADGSTYYAGWFIDNINIKEAPVLTSTWSPIDNLYTDALATIPYVDGANAATVYFKSDLAMTQTDYEVTVVGAAGCEVSQTVSISNIFVDNPIVLPQTFCEEIEVASVVVTGLTPGATLKWFPAETATTEITEIFVSGTYYVIQEMNGCSSERVPVEITINRMESVPEVNPVQKFCGNHTIADLVVNPLSGYSVGWFSTETSTEQLALTELLISGIYYVSQYDGFCWSPRAEVSVIVNQVPDVPVVVDQIFCEALPLNLINFGQDADVVLNWYSTATSTNMLPMTTQVATGIYYVSQTVDECESARVAVSIVVLEMLQAPIAPASQLYCGVTLFSDLEVASSGGIIGWFDSLDTTIPIDVTQNVVTGTYYVAQYNGACWSDTTTVHVIVNMVPLVPISSNIHLCGSFNFGQISVGQVAGATLNWYVTPTSITPLNLMTSVVSGTYYVSQTVEGCESARIPIIISHIDSLDKPTAVSQTFCGSAIVADLIAEASPGASIIWYSSSVSNYPLSPNAALATGTYYAAQTMNGCISARFPISVFVVSSAAPNVGTFNFCGSATVADLVLPAPTGVVYKWFNSPSNPTQLDGSTPLVTGIYFVSRTQFGCESLRTPVTVVVNSIPQTPSGITPQAFLEGSTISDIVMNQPNVVWYISAEDAANGVYPLSPGTTLVNGTIYYGVIIGTNNCPSLPFLLTVDVYLSNDEFVKNELKYYPNPVEDILNVTYSERILQIEVFDLLGKRVKVKSTDDKEVNIDLSDLASGTYMIQLKTETKQQFIKVVKK